MSVSKNSKYTDILKILKKIRKTKNKNKSLGFLIGTTSKTNFKKFYFTPIREFNSIIIFGVIINNLNEAKTLSKIVDNKVDYIFVDSEKKIKDTSYKIDKFSSVERAVKENTKISKVLTYKGNDITVEALDLLLANFTNNENKRLDGKKISILGAGNLGTKIAIKLLERGANVNLFRRNQIKLKKIIEAINIIKPKFTKQSITYFNDLNKITKNADFIIGATNGSQIIDNNILKNAKKNVIIVDVGKGTITHNAIKEANEKNISLYRLDITPALCGMLESNVYFDKIFRKTIGTKKIYNQRLISGGILAEINDIVVDNVNKPSIIYGIADGKGDLKKNILKSDKIKINKIKKLLKIN